MLFEAIRKPKWNHRKNAGIGLLCSQQVNRSRPTVLNASGGPIFTFNLLSIDHFEDYFCFIGDLKIGPTNNLAERAIRFLASRRPVCCLKPSFQA